MRYYNILIQFSKIGLKNLLHKRYVLQIHVCIYNINGPINMNQYNINNSRCEIQIIILSKMQ